MGSDESVERFAAQQFARTDDPNTWPPHIRERYGIGRPRSRTGLMIILVVALFTAPLLARYAWRSGTEQGLLAMPSHRVVSETRVVLNLSYAGRDRDFICAVRAQDYNRSDVGYVYLVLRAGTARAWSYSLNTRARAVTASVIACEPGRVPTRLPAPQFPPGVKPPAQESPGLTPRADGGFATVRHYE